MADPFSRGIDNLVVPERAKIESLRMIAEDASGDPRAVAGICDTIIDRLHRVEPPRKIAVLYLMDAILKNLGGEFERALASKIVDAVLHVYFSVAPADQLRVRSTLKTWVDARLFNVEVPIIYSHIQSSSSSMLLREPQLPPSAKRMRVEEPYSDGRPLHQHYGEYPHSYAGPPEHSGYHAPAVPAGYTHDPHYPLAHPHREHAHERYAHAPAAPLAYPPVYAQRPVEPLHYAGEGQVHHPTPAPHYGYPRGAPVARSGTSMPQQPSWQAQHHPHTQIRMQPAPGPHHPGMIPRPTMPPSGHGYGQGYGPAPVSDPRRPSSGSGSSVVMHHGGVAPGHGTTAPYPTAYPLAKPAVPVPGVGAAPGNLLEHLLSSLRGASAQPPHHAAVAAPGAESSTASTATLATTSSSIGTPSEPPSIGYRHADLSAVEYGVVDPFLTDVSLATLGQQDRSPSLNLHYRQPHRCAQCALRFPSPQELREHQGVHAKEAAEAKSRMFKSRPWYPAVAQWEVRSAHATPLAHTPVQGSSSSSGGGGPHEDDAASQSGSESDSEHIVPAHLPNATCEVCMEPFARRWDDASEGWVYVGAVDIGGALYHTSCAQSMN